MQYIEQSLYAWNGAFQNTILKSGHLDDRETHHLYQCTCSVDMLVHASRSRWQLLKKFHFITPKLYAQISNNNWAQNKVCLIELITTKQLWSVWVTVHVINRLCNQMKWGNTILWAFNTPPWRLLHDTIIIICFVVLLDLYLHLLYRHNCRNSGLSILSEQFIWTFAGNIFLVVQNNEVEPGIEYSSGWLVINCSEPLIIGCPIALSSVDLLHFFQNYTEPLLK